MKVLIIGSGGREHAIAWKVAQSSQLTKLYIAPGNPGAAALGENVAIKVDDHPALVQLCKEKNIDLVVVGPEGPLAVGLADDLRAAGFKVFGPSKAAAEIEASKTFSKAFMLRHGIPTARYEAFDNFDLALDHLRLVDYPVVIKASGLAAGKGVILPESAAEAESVLRQVMLEHEFGAAGDEVVIEERISGPEVSLIAFCDGNVARPMVPAQDHKRVFDGDRGPNTGGMGAYAPVPVCPPEMVAELTRTILQPAVDGLRAEGRAFIGVLYAGLMLTADGPRVIEFNCRFGDPETQVILPLLDSDILDIFEACADGRLANSDIRWKDGAAACVVLASGGYPGKYLTGYEISGLDTASSNAYIFHAGTKLVDGKIVTAGGRVLCVSGWGSSIREALDAAYAAIGPVSFEGAHYRKDIASQAVKTDAGADGDTDKRIHPWQGIAEPRGEYLVSQLLRLPTDELTYKVNGFAMQVHDELKAGQAEKFYQRRLAELCQEAGLAVELEKRLEVWIAEKMVGYLKLDLWVDERLVVECKSFSHQLGTDQVGQVLTYLAATGSQVGTLYNFGRGRLEMKRILAPRDVVDWHQHLYRFIHKSPGMVLPPLGKSGTVPPIRFKVFGEEKKRQWVEIPSPTGAAIRLSASRSAPASVSAPSTYAESGVSIEAGNRAVELMKSAVKSTYGPQVLAGIGSFGGLFDASALKDMKNPVLVASTDGVGTKVKLAAEAGRYRSVGHDIVNHCIDDILVQGARPLFFMDYFATSKLTPEIVAEVVTGIAEACRASGCALLGGETAEMPGVYVPGEFDIAGTIVGVLERESMLPRPNIGPGDVLIGIRSSGPHTNGYSLIRKTFQGISLETIFPELGISLADALLAPHRSYLNALSTVLGQRSTVKGLAHLTGGGFIENIPRILPEGVDAVVRQGSWPVPPLFGLIQSRGEIAPEEMHRVFNMGIGMVVVVAKEDVEKVQKAIPEETYVLGELIVGDKKVKLLSSLV